MVSNLLRLSKIRLLECLVIKVSIYETKRGYIYELRLDLSLSTSNDTNFCLLF